MSNTNLTPTIITREAQRVLHQKLNFVGTINRQYDDRFSESGASIGDTLQVRLPNEFVVRTGKAINTQDVEDKKVDLVVATQKGVDTNFSSKELTLDIDSFSEKILQPAMSVLAANIESDALSMYKDVHNQVDNIGSAATFAKLMSARKQLVDNLTPPGDLSINLNTQDNVDLVDAMKGLFHDSGAVKKQYREGMMGRTAGFNFYENTLAPQHTTGTAAASSGYVTNGADQTGSSIVVDTGSNTFLKGDIITIAGVNRVHPETKADTGVLQTFVITADSGASATSLSISPEIIATGAYRNVSAAAGDGKAIVKHGGASATHGISLAYHKNAFALATADLIMPEDTHWAAREVFDGISMRIVRAYDINNDQFPCRIDVLYGYKTIRGQLASRCANN